MPSRPNGKTIVTILALAGAIAVGVSLLRRTPSASKTLPAATEKIAPPSTPSAPPPTPALNSVAVAKLQEAIQAQLARRHSAADALFREAIATEPRLKGVFYQRAVVAFEERDFVTSRTLARDSLARKEEVAPCLILLGTMSGLEGRHEDALADFLAAAEADPANPLPPYNASESLRHLRRPADAIGVLRDAMQRNPGEPLYAFKLRLARIEAGQEADLEAEIRRQLTVKPPAGDWILTAAAVSLRHRRFAEAAGLLSAAKQVMQPALFFSLLQDDLFASHRTHAEIAPFFDVKVGTNPAKPSP